MVCMLRLNLFEKRLGICLLLLQNIVITIIDRRYINLILFNIHIYCWSWRYNHFPNFYYCSITNNLLEIKIQFDCQRNHTLLIRIYCCFSFLACIWYKQIYTHSSNIEQCWNSFFPSLVDLVRFIKLQSSVHLLFQCNYCLPSDQCYPCFNNG